MENDAAKVMQSVNQRSRVQKKHVKYMKLYPNK